MSRVPSFVVPLVLSSVCACGSSSSSSGSSSGPVIDSLQAPSTFTVSGGGYTVIATIQFHDDHAAITALRERIPAYAQDVKTAVSAPQGPQQAQLELGLTSTQPLASGTMVDIDVTLLDANNAESNVEVVHVAVP